MDDKEGNVEPREKATAASSKVLHAETAKQGE